VTVASIICPDLLVTKEVFAQIDIRSEQSYGRTNCDYFGNMNREPNCKIAVDINVEKFWDIVEAGIRQYG
jgi:ribosylpyrimidine nucleosidase